MTIENPYYPDAKSKTEDIGDAMIRLANVLIVDANSSRAAVFKERLSRGGYHAAIAQDQDAALSIAAAEHPDLVLIGDMSIGIGMDLAVRLKKNAATADIPIVVVADHVSAEISARCLEIGIDDVMYLGCDDAELFARMRPLVRLATMHAELSQRSRAAAVFGVKARDRLGAAETNESSVLIIGDDTAAMVQSLSGHVATTCAATLYEAEDLLIQHNYDAAILSFHQDPEGLLNFCSQVRNNPRLFNLPIVVLAGMGVDSSDAYRRGASRVLAHPVDPIVLKSAVLTLVRRQQLRWSIRGALNESLRDATRDPVTGSYSRAFLDSYLAARVETAKNQDRHLAVVFFSAPNIDGVRQQFGDDAALHLTQQVSQWITGLLRAEDVTAAFKPNEFCVVLPDTPVHEAEVVMHRIAGVLAYTDFAVREVYQPVKVWVQVSCTVVGKNDTVENVVARARQNLD